MYNRHIIIKRMEDQRENIFNEVHYDSWTPLSLAIAHYENTQYGAGHSANPARLNSKPSWYWKLKPGKILLNSVLSVELQINADPKPIL